MPTTNIHRSDSEKRYTAIISTTGVRVVIVNINQQLPCSFRKRFAIIPPSGSKMLQVAPAQQRVCLPHIWWFPAESRIHMETHHGHYHVMNPKHTSLARSYSESSVTVALALTSCSSNFMLPAGIDIQKGREVMDVDCLPCLDNWRRQLSGRS